MNKNKPFLTGGRFNSSEESMSGIPREILEYLKSSTTLANETIKELKKSDKKTIFHILLGAFIAFILGIGRELILKDTTVSDTKELKIQLVELNKTMNDFHTDFHILSLEIVSLQKKKDSLKNSELKYKTE